MAFTGTYTVDMKIEQHFWRVKILLFNMIPFIWELLALICLKLTLVGLQILENQTVGHS